jgi:hypothetical protein
VLMGCPVLMDSPVSLDCSSVELSAVITDMAASEVDEASPSN